MIGLVFLTVAACRGFEWIRPSAEAAEHQDNQGSPLSPYAFGKWGEVGLFALMGVAFWLISFGALLTRVRNRRRAERQDRLRAGREAEQAWRQLSGWTAPVSAGGGQAGANSLARVCPMCSQELPAFDATAGIMPGCPQCGQPVVNTAALTVERSRGFHRLYAGLLVFCVLLSPGLIVCVVTMLAGLAGTVWPSADAAPEELPNRILIGSLGTVGYGLLAAATVLFGRAAYRAPGRARRAIAATAALTASLLAGLAIVILTCS